MLSSGCLWPIFCQSSRGARQFKTDGVSPGLPGDCIAAIKRRQCRRACKQRRSDCCATDFAIRSPSSRHQLLSSARCRNGCCVPHHDATHYCDCIQLGAARCDQAWPSKQQAAALSLRRRPGPAGSRWRCGCAPGGAACVRVTSWRPMGALGSRRAHNSARTRTHCRAAVVVTIAVTAAVPLYLSRGEGRDATACAGRSTCSSARMQRSSS